MGCKAPLTAENEQEEKVRASSAFPLVHFLQSPPQTGGDMAPQGTNPP